MQLLRSALSPRQRIALDMGQTALQEAAKHRPSLNEAPDAEASSFLFREGCCAG